MRNEEEIPETSMNKFLTLSELELRARLRKEVDIAVEAVKQVPVVDMSEWLAYEEKEVFEAIRKQRERDDELYNPIEPDKIPEQSIDQSDLRHHTFEDFVGSKEYQKNIKRLQKVKPPKKKTGISIQGRNLNFNPHKSEDDILDGLVEKISE